MNIVGVPVIMALVYGIIELIKIPVKSEKFKSFIPLIAGVMGGVLGILIFFISPEIMLTENVFFSFLLGLCSGLSATGSNQLVKQILDFSKTENTTTIEETTSTEETDKE